MIKSNVIFLVNIDSKPIDFISNYIGEIPINHLVTIIVDSTIVLCIWGERGLVTKSNLRLTALPYSAYQEFPNYNHKSSNRI